MLGGNLMRNAIAAIAALTIGVFVAAPRANLSNSEIKRIQEASTVLTELHAVPEKDVPRDLWDKAECAVVIPGLKKAAFVFGGEWGKGLMSCRHAGGWSAPVFMEMTKGSWGFQIGAESVDLVLLVMNDHGMDKLLESKVSLGGDISVAAGPVGRDGRAATDAQLKAEILSYSRAQGLFAGIDISGGVMEPDKSDTADLYGSSVAPREVLKGAKPAPPEAQIFMRALDRSSGVVGTSGTQR
jgi:lipid-binding SYLF domain-containing protein